MSLKRDAGYTLVELLVALFLALMATVMFGSALSVVQKTSLVQLEKGVTISQVRQALVALDAQMRSGFGARLIDPPPPGYAYKFVIYVPDSGAGRCTGWRLTDASPQVLQMATWAAGTDPATAVWSDMAGGIRNNVLDVGSLASPAPKAFAVRGYPQPTPSTGIALDVRLWVDSGTKPTSTKRATLFTTTLTTRNIRRYDTKIMINGTETPAYQVCG